MFTYVTKSRYWDILNKNIMLGIAGANKWHLKDIQDAVAYSYLHDKVGFDIAEIGAGHSRLLGSLAKNNRCYAIDEYKGFGGGPKNRPSIGDVKFIDCIIGNSEDYIRDASFDAIFSVSVVEHVPSDRLASFFSDCHRILKPGGLMVHLIDVYVEGIEGDNNALWNRLKEYMKPFEEDLFKPLGSIDFKSLADIKFKTTLASNPDNVMRDWNKASPILTEKRIVAQSCSIEMAGYRTPFISNKDQT